MNHLKITNGHPDLGFSESPQFLQAKVGIVLQIISRAFVLKSVEIC